jgi:hypothetical protein
VAVGGAVARIVTWQDLNHSVSASLRYSYRALSVAAFTAYFIDSVFSRRPVSTERILYTSP